MQRLAVALACLFSLTASLSAESRKFPYEAVVRADNVTVRCAQGKNGYATSRVKKGDILTVHRHDPGGWFMISPPEGSFSWIAAEHVKSENAGVGTVSLPEGDTEGAPVWVGSELGNDHSVRQRVLHTGDTVQIIGEDIFQTNTGSTRVYKIVPPLREFRWVKGDFVVPADENLQREALNDPFSNPFGPTSETVAEAEAEEETAVKKAEVAVLPPPSREPSAKAASRDSNDPKAALREIDRHYSEMVERDPKDWDIEELARSYEGLAVTAPQLATPIRQRLAALEDRRKIHAEYRAFAQLSAQTTQRDQELAAQTVSASTSTTELATDFTLGDPSPLEVTGQVASAGPTIMNSPPPAYESVVPSQPASVRPQLNGAGIVQRLPNGRFAIMAPEGRLLAVLQADRSVPLDRYVGQPMGFVGERSFDPRIGSDLLVVKQMIPIQLQR
jgi:hypothetical protein